MNDALGYEFLRQSLGLSAFPVKRPALLKPVTRVEPAETFLAIPRQVAPASDHPLEHLLFALKHEGTNLQVLMQAAPRVPPSALLEELRRSPKGAYIRTACYLWEAATGQVLEDLPAASAATVNLFDPERYITGPAQRNARWKINFNGLGSLHYCPFVERTPTIEAAIQSDILGRTQTFLAALGQGMMDRALAWAYLHETEDSFAIEREKPSEDRARAFVALLQQAHERQPLSEDYLVDLQSSTISNPRDQAIGFRTDQNWLRGPMRGAAGVTYIPPPPPLARELMQALMAFANRAPKAIDPIVAASVTSFGFVFIHPFMDGNGRLSRFLFHHALCQSGRLAKGLLLPVSVAMKRYEADYLQTLQDFSRPARNFWQVRWIDEGVYEFTFQGDPSIYRYWDATPGVEFGFRMAEQALEVELRQETDFLARYDVILRAVNDRFDVRGNDLATLVLACLDNNGVVSQRRRKQFSDRVPDDLFGFLEDTAKRVMGGETAEDADGAPTSGLA